MNTTIPVILIISIILIIPIIPPSRQAFPHVPRHQPLPQRVRRHQSRRYRPPPLKEIKPRAGNGSGPDGKSSQCGRWLPFPKVRGEGTGGSAGPRTGPRTVAGSTPPQVRAPGRHAAALETLQKVNESLSLPINPVTKQQALSLFQHACPHYCV